MRRQRLLPKMRKGMSMRWSVLSLLAGELLIWQLALPSVALAFQAPISRMASSLPPQAQEALDIAGVSVVRLEVAYAAPSTETHPLVPQHCTGLGVLVGSWPASTSTPQSPDFINWVLTDTTLVTQAKLPVPPCAPPSTAPANHGAGQLSLASIQMDGNAAYGGGTISSAVFGMFDVLAPSTPPCSSPCILTTDFHLPPQGGVLFAFHTSSPQPFVTVAPSDAGAVLGIELANNTTASAAWPASPLVPQAAGQPLAQFLTPLPYPLSGGRAVNEPGLPVVNSSGELTALRLTQGTLLASDLSKFMNSQADLQPSAAHSNMLKTAWDTGVKEFYAGNYPGALLALQQASGKNPDFLAPSVFEKKVPNPSPPSPPSGFFGIPFWVLAIVEVVGLAVLLAILVLVSLNFGRKRAQQRRELARFKADQAEAQRRVEIEEQRQQQALQTPKRDQGPMASVPQQSSYYAWPSPEPTPIESGEIPASSVFQQQQSLPVQQSSPIVSELKTTPINPVPASDLRCPNCGQAVPATATFCPNCRYQLSPLVQSSRSPLSTAPVMEMSMSNQAPRPSIVFQPSQESVTEPVWDDRIVRETLRRLWDREG